MGKRKISSDRIISFSAIIIAIVSIIVAIWQGIEFRNYNRLSVKPLLDISYSLNYDKNLVEFTVKNYGMGPAIIGEATAKVDSSEYIINDTNQLFQFLNKLGIDKVPVTFNNLELGGIILPNEHFNIFVVEIHSLEKLGINTNTLINNVNIKIKYKSLYNEEFVVSQ